jgi:hypothetical protein
MRRQSALGGAGVSPVGGEVGHAPACRPSATDPHPREVTILRYLISFDDGSVTVDPFPETKPVIGGFSIFEVASQEEALTWAAKIAKACRCAQEVREIMYDPES